MKEGEEEGEGDGEKEMMCCSRAQCMLACSGCLFKYLLAAMSVYRTARDQMEGESTHGAQSQGAGE